MWDRLVYMTYLSHIKMSCLFRCFTLYTTLCQAWACCSSDIFWCSVVTSALFIHMHNTCVNIHCCYRAQARQLCPCVWEVIYIFSSQLVMSVVHRSLFTIVCYFASKAHDQLVSQLMSDFRDVPDSEYGQTRFIVSTSSLNLKPDLCVGN